MYYLYIDKKSMGTQIFYLSNDLAQPKMSPTVCMKSLTIISGQLHLLHQFRSDFAHLLAFINLVIKLLNAKK